MGYEEKRRRVANYLEEITSGKLTYNKVPYADKQAVAVEGLLSGVVTVDEISPKAAKFVALDLVKGAPYRVRDAAADKGTEVHDWAEKIALGTATIDSVPDLLKGHVYQWQSMVDHMQLQFEATEFTVYNRTHKYAGSGDFLARSRRYPEMGMILGDYKTSESGIWPDIALQLAALRYGEFIGLPSNAEVKMPKVKTCVGVSIKSDSWQVVEVKANEEVFQYFLSAMHIARWKNDVEATVLGKSIYNLAAPKETHATA